jgi:hypothetical protein
MNTSAIRKHYDKLTPRERLTAFLAADLRDDDDEVRAIAYSAEPVERRKLEEVRIRLIILALSIACEQWRLAANLLFLACSESDEWSETAGVAAYGFTTRAEAWRVLCKEYGIDGAALWDKLDCDSTGLAMHELIMGKVAYSQEETAEVLKARGMDADKLLTVDTLVSGWRRLVSTPERG